ncbi:MAG: hypothetical protein CL681_27690 [Blastopirellula sp.]|nr:hypothetical protein [Blastopirellula sp.]
MRSTPLLVSWAAIGLSATLSTVAAEPVGEPAVRAAITKSIPRLEQAMKDSADQRKCFTCHNQALPMIAMAAARQRGFAVDDANFKRQHQHTVDHLAGGKARYVEGRGQGGRVVTAGYALWTLEVAGQERNELTSLVAKYLLETQKKNQYWHQSSKRPPTAGSDFMTTYIALRALQVFGADAQQPALQERSQQVRKWLQTAMPNDHEDRVFRLRLIHLLKEDPQRVNQAVDALLKSQREDGGWSQTEKLTSDAYATGTALATLLEVQPQSPHADAIARATRFLIDQQLEDGSWHVTTRADGFQEYFEAGYPHDEDQFISVAAGAWATNALLLTLPPLDQATASPR